MINLTMSFKNKSQLGHVIQKENDRKSSQSSYCTETLKTYHILVNGMPGLRAKSQEYLFSENISGKKSGWHLVSEKKYENISGFISGSQNISEKKSEKNMEKIWKKILKWLVGTLEFRNSL